MPAIRSATAILTMATDLAAANPFAHVHPDADPVIERTFQNAREHPVTFGAPWDNPRNFTGTAPTFVFTGDNPEGDNPADVIFTPDGTTIVIAHRESRNLILWDANTNAFDGEVALPGAPQSIAITPDGTTAVVTLVDTDEASFVDMTTGTVLSTIPVGLNPGPVAINAAGDLAIVGVTGTGAAVVLDIAARTITRIIPNVGFGQTFSFNFESPAFGLRYTELAPLGDDRVLNADPSADEAQFINMRTGAVTRLPIAASSRGVAVSADNSTAAIAHAFSGRTLTVLDTATETITNTFTPPVDLWGPIALNADGTRAVAAIQNAARTVNLTTGAFGPTINTASLNDLVTTADGQRAVGIGFNGPVIDIASGALLGFANTVVSTDVGAVSPVGDRAAMCSTTFGDDLVIIETDSTPALQSFQLSGPPPEGDRARTTAISPDGSTAVAVNILSDTLAIVDTQTRTVTGYAPLGQRPSGVAITPDGTTAVVANLDSTFASVVDLATATTTNVPISRRASRVEISPDGTFAYLPVVASGDGVWRIDLTTNAASGGRIATGNMGGVGYPYSQTSDMKLSPDGSTLAVAGSFDNIVSLIDTATWTLTANVPAGDFPTYLAFSDDGNTLAVANRNTDTVTLIDLDRPVPAAVGAAPVGDFPGQLAFDNLGNLYIVNSSDDTIGVVNPATLTQTAVIPIPDTIAGIHINNDTRTLAVAWGTATTTFGGTLGFDIAQDGNLSIYDLATLDLIETINAGVAPSDLAVNADGTAASLAAPLGDGLSILNLFNGCNPADLAPPAGTLNIDDVLAFLNAFANADPAADLAPPAGTLNIDDVLAFVNTFAAGCP